MSYDYIQQIHIKSEFRYFVRCSVCGSILRGNSVSTLIRKSKRLGWRVKTSDSGMYSILCYNCLQKRYRKEEQETGDDDISNDIKTVIYWYGRSHGLN